MALSLVVAPKRLGGLGIKDGECMNIAVLGKLIWQMNHCQQKLWVRIIHAKYLRHGLHLEQSASSEGLTSTYAGSRCNLGSESLAHCFYFCLKALQLECSGFGETEIMTYLVPQILGMLVSYASLFYWISPSHYFVKLNCANGHFADFGRLIKNSMGEWVTGCYGCLKKTNILRFDHFDLLTKIKDMLLRDWEVTVRLIQRTANNSANHMAKHAASNQNDHIEWIQSWSDFIVILQQEQSVVPT
ncbi:hypothetical protein PIB30_054173 [Stylosanthes scabra]|uniref:RNase H type-1 domain-containing protein n=1 Tax=Stylosanthes scabra TaxID=79078 RepID=A0ABU6VLU5_9FABA|nr:hypothetical protein [Stylosanthes scabra]